ncbi:MAG: type I-E CRISPR-associated protein Cse1/CasA [Burkholderiales bacterium]
MTPAFNLLDEPWIPVRSLAGEVREVGLLELFERASQLEGLAETSPPNLVALYRVLLAVTHRALTRTLGTWKDADRARWYRDGLPDGALRDYLKYWRDRFWVFHPEHPFMQVAALATLPETKDKLKPWTQVALDRANGNTPSVFDHAVDDAPTPVRWQALMRDLLGFLQFTPGGLVKSVRASDKAAALSNTAACIPLGSNLSRTLCLALHPRTTGEIEDAPTWERSPTTLAALKSEGRLASGPNDRYTRLSRAVLLATEPDGDGLVRHIRFAAGVALIADDNDPDPMASYRVGKAGAVRLTFQEGRALWRDLPTLVPDPSGRHALPAPVLQWATNVHLSTNGRESHVPFIVAGIASDQAKLLRWRADRIVLPAAVLADPDSAQGMRQAVSRAEQTFSSLRGIATDMLAAAMPDSKHKDTRARARALLDRSGFAATFFGRAERSLPLLLQQVAGGEFDAAERHWSGMLAAAAEESWDGVLALTGRSPAALRAEARAWPRFRGFIRRLDNFEPHETTSAEEIDA